MISRLVSRARIRLKKPPRAASGNEFAVSIARADDVFLCSYPRSGNTWINYLLAFYRFPLNDIDVIKINHYIPDIYWGMSKGFLELPSPRVLKSHELFDARYPRVIYLIRDGRDAYFSYYHFRCACAGYKGSFEEFIRQVTTGEIWPSSWHEHVESWLVREHTTPITVIRYEDLLLRTLDVLRQIVLFIGWEWSESAGQRAIDLASLDRIWRDHKKHGWPGGVAGTAGAWRRNYSPEMLCRLYEASGVVDVLRHFGYELD